MAKRNYPTEQPGEPSQSTLPTPENVSALLLCGGAGTRMGGCDKGLLRFDGELAIRRCARLLQPLCETVFISANRNLPTYRSLAIGKVLPDLRAGFPGPLAALEAVDKHLETPYLLLLPCDLPLLGNSVPSALLEALTARADQDVVYAQTQPEESNTSERAGTHYLCAALRRDCLGELEGFMDRGGRAVKHWYGSLRSRPLGFSGPLASGFFNVNSKADLAAAMHACGDTPTGKARDN